MTSRQTDPLLPQLKGRELGNVHFIDVGMEDTVDETDGWRFVWILIW
jgi:hypothetical protein